jgi:hypothetical protein
MALRGWSWDAAAGPAGLGDRPPLEAAAATYHGRWEIETALDEVKVHQWAHPRPRRSKRPREVVQEANGLLPAHLGIRTLMHQAARREGIDPDRLSFTGALRVLRRAIPRPADPPRAPPPLCAGLLSEPAAERLPPRRPRQNPRAVRRKMSNYKLKRPPPAGSPTTPGPPAPPTIRVLWP